MVNKLTAKEAAEQVLEKTKYPMSISEIYEYAVDKLDWRVGGKKPKTKTMEDTLKRNTGDRGPFVLIKSGWGMRKYWGLRQYKDRYDKDTFYVAKNPDHKDDLLKIGITHNLTERLRSLSGQTAASSDFIALYAVVSRKAGIFEKTLKKMFDHNRREGKEYFEVIKVENIRPFIDSHKIDSHKDEVKVILDEEHDINLMNAYEAARSGSTSSKSTNAESKKNRPKKTKYTGPFNFREIGIPRGAILRFIKRCISYLRSI